MYELIQTGEKSWYIKNPANVGVYDLGGGEVCLIDAGNDKEAGRKILKKVTEAGWRVSCIINTHSNADHVGGNQFIQSRTGCRVLSTDIENAIARHPELESSLLYGGYPYAELRNKFLLAKPTESTEEIESALPPGLRLRRVISASSAVSSPSHCACGSRRMRSASFWVKARPASPPR